MDLNTITMERPKARQAFLDYRNAVRQGGGAEDKAIMRGYRELARGTPPAASTTRACPASPSCGPMCRGAG